MNPPAARPQTGAQIIAELAPSLPEGQREPLRLFIEHLLSGPRAQRLFATAFCCDTRGVGELFAFLLTAPETGEDGIKVNIALPERQRDDQCVHGGVRILVHLKDTPFAFDTLRNYLKKNNLSVFAQTHLTLGVTRDGEGRLTALDPDARSGERELFLVTLTERSQGVNAVKRIQEELTAALVSVKRSVTDFRAMVARVREEADLMGRGGHVEESRFLTWVVEDNFVFMGVRDYRVQQQVVADDSRQGLGVFRGADAFERVERIMPGMQEEVDQILHTISPSAPLTIEYGHHGQSIIYASEGVDFFTVRRLGGDSLLLVLGRFSRTALASQAASVPVLTRHLEETLALCQYPPGSHLYQEFKSLFNRMPLRELFYSEPATITRQIQDILTIQGDIDVRVMARLGRCENYVAVLTVLSANRFRAGLDHELAALLSRHLCHPVSSTTVSESGTLFFILSYATHTPGQPLDFRREAVEAEVRERILTWEDRFREALADTLPAGEASDLYNRYAPRFDPLYREATPPRESLLDLGSLHELAQDGPFASRVVVGDGGRVFIKLYTSLDIDLTRIVQTFNNFGVICLHEFSSEITPPEGERRVRIQRFEVGGGEALREQLAARADLFCEALAAVQNGWMMDDSLNRLVLTQGFAYREVSLIRTLRQYLLQINPHLAGPSVSRVINTHSHLTRLILAAFKVRFAPEVKSRRKEAEEIREAFEKALASVVSLQDDQVLRRLFNITQSGLRTNYFQLGKGGAVISLKIDSTAIEKMPSPRPWREIVVHSPHMEGIHLRSGPVARGGLRHSDRLEDYRTEVLGLMKTQKVKNALIVPVGAKGGFVVRNLEETPPEQRKEWVATQYGCFIQALLEVTDNRVEGRCVHPPHGAIYDGEDPYFVVAADKGTATFSDLANAIAGKHNRFWLGDAFASGGSQGYDHKKVGITARGAWECIKLHFAELGRDIAAETFTVVGIGDMAGDVFGNGMLRSDRIKLVGAFNHQHIFLDPDPDPLASFAERKRLFELPRSSWSDYDRAAISQGGGIFERSAKAIPLSPPLKKLLRSKSDTLSGEQVIRRLLTARVDLLYNGGIGTYVKGSGESHLEVSDKANDAVRVNGTEVQAAIVGEGGNLGFTQKARLEYALRGGPNRQGGRINTDAVDNSGGVDLSDHEVNLKILLDLMVAAGELPGAAERNALLLRLTDEVAQSVLADNRMQHLAISRDEMLSSRMPETFLEGLKLLHEQAGLDFTDEDVPPAEELAALSGPWPRPLLAIMFGYLKMMSYQRLLASDVIDLFFFERFLGDYFPPSIARDYGSHLAGHYLKREIIATTMVNRVINQTGVGMLVATYQEIRKAQVDVAPLPTLIKAYLIADLLLDGADFRRKVDLLPTQVEAARKQEMRIAQEEVLLHLSAWMVNHLDHERITTDIINLYGKVILSFRNNLWTMLPKLLSPDHFRQMEERRAREVAAGLPEELATETVLMPYLKEAMTILHIKETLHSRFEVVGHLYIQVDDYFGISWLEESLGQVRPRDQWGRMTLENVRKELVDTRARMVMAIINFKRHSETVMEAFANYVKEVEPENEEYQGLLSQIRGKNLHDLMPLSVLVRKLRELLLRDKEEG